MLESITGLIVKNAKLDAQLAELESCLAFQEITIEKLNQTLIEHELEMSNLRNLIRLLMEKIKVNQSHHVFSQYEERPPHY